LGDVPVLGLALLGFVIGMHESVLRAGVAEISGVEKRATAYGFLYIGSGVGFFLGSFTMGYLYDLAVEYLLIFSLVIEALAVCFLIPLIRQNKR
ncbi:MAG: MFS transporter, partial [Archaeoglobaceae archaeon]